MLVLVYNPVTQTFLARPGLARGRCKGPDHAKWFADTSSAEHARATLGDPWVLVYVALTDDPIRALEHQK